MGLFTSRKRSLMQGNRDNRLDNPSVQRQVLGHIFHNAARRQPEGEALQLGRRVQVSIPDGKHISVVADGQEVFRYPCRHTYAFFHMGHGGLDLVYRQGGQQDTVILHYTDTVRR
nr:hypothetical protein [bacterium]